MYFVYVTSVDDVIARGKPFDILISYFFFLAGKTASAEIHAVDAVDGDDWKYLLYVYIMTYRKNRKERDTPSTYIVQTL